MKNLRRLGLTSERSLLVQNGYEAKTRFTTRLAETIAWCRQRVDPRDPKWSLRSAELRPLPTIDREDGITFWQAAEYVESVAARRSLLLSAATAVPMLSGDAVSAELAGGRLLACMYELNNHNGMTADVTAGYFDDFDNAPWDSWVDILYFEHEALNLVISWVPKEFVPLAEEAVLNECVGILSWPHEPRWGRMKFEPDVPAWLGALR